MSGLKKRSFSLSGHRTSVALEEEFWAMLDAEANAQGMSLAAFVSSIDKARGDGRSQRAPARRACRSETEAPSLLTAADTMLSAVGSRTGTDTRETRT